MDSDTQRDISDVQMPSNVVTKNGVTKIDGLILKASIIAEEFCRTDEEIAARRKKFKKSLESHGLTIELLDCTFD